MRRIPDQHKRVINDDPYFRECARKNVECEGRITIEHAFCYANRQINELWNYIPLCEFHHLGNGLNKRTNYFIAAGRTTKEDRTKYDKIIWHNFL